MTSVKADFFLDQYGHVYNYDETPDGKASRTIIDNRHSAATHAEKAFIINACNNHADLLKALTDLLREYKANIEPLDACERATIDYCEHVISKAEAA